MTLVKARRVTDVDSYRVGDTEYFTKSAEGKVHKILTSIAEALNDQNCRID